MTPPTDRDREMVIEALAAEFERQSKGASGLYVDAIQPSADGASKTICVDGEVDVTALADAVLRALTGEDVPVEALRAVEGM